MTSTFEDRFSGKLKELISNFDCCFFDKLVNLTKMENILTDPLMWAHYSKKPFWNSNLEFYRKQTLQVEYLEKEEN
jgi:hypothetical protein